jgi:hypothetical protein
MTPIEHYQPPSAAELAQLKARLTLTSQQMAIWRDWQAAPS